MENKMDKHGQEKKKDEKSPAGGFEKAPVPSVPPGYTVKFTFHRANNLPLADLNSLSSDPFLVAQLNTNIPTRHEEDPRLQFRTPTIRRSINPVWNSEWVVANVPGSGFALKARIYDEDPADHDDRLGNVHVHVDRLSDGWEGIKEQPYGVKKRMGSKRAYTLRGCTAMFSPSARISPDLIVSVEVLGKTETSNGGRLWTVGPCYWSQHFSPMIGRIAGTKEPGKNGEKGNTEKYNFQANQIQLAGPVPQDMYHRYVEFKPFIQGMFTGKSLHGWLLNHALHHQHARVYNYDRQTVYGCFPSPSQDMSLQFLDLVHWDKGGRIYTYVVTLDGQWRFTERGKEFGIDLLSKHTMHSDVNIYIAFSSEFFIRRLKSPYKSGAPDEQATHPPEAVKNGPPSGEPPKVPAYYSLVIDNDSGTYRPNAKLIPQLKEFMQRNLPGMKIVTLDCNGDKDRMNKWKEEQRGSKKAEGDGTVMVQDDSSSMSSSDEEDLNDRARIARGEAKMSKKEKVEAKVEEPMQKVKGIGEGKREREERETREDLGEGSA